MDQALHDERLECFLRHNEASEKIRQLRADQLKAHQRITQIDAIEQAERKNPDRSKDQGVR